MSKNLKFGHLIPLNLQIKILALSLFLLNWPLTSCEVSEKTNARSLRYLQTDRRIDRQTDGQGRLLWTPTGKPGVQNHTILWPFPKLYKNTFKVIWMHSKFQVAPTIHKISKRKTSTSSVGFPASYCLEIMNISCILNLQVNWTRDIDFENLLYCKLDIDTNGTSFYCFWLNIN